MSEARKTYLGVIPGGCASEGRHILNQHNFVLVLGEADFLAFNVGGCDVVERHASDLVPEQP